MGAYCQARHNKHWKKGWCLLRRAEGSITLEAALVMPFFASFLFAMLCIVRLTVADIALQHAVSETVKQLSAHAYPVHLLAEEARTQYNNSSWGSWLEQTKGRIASAREQVAEGETWVDNYRAFIPDVLLQWVDWEREQRLRLEQAGQDEYESFLEQHVRPHIQAAFREAVLHYADASVLQGDHLRVTHVGLPSLFDATQPYLEVEAAYEVKLPIPFAARTVVLRKRAYERLWIGAS